MSETVFPSPLPGSASASASREALPHLFSSTHQVETGGSIRVFLAGELDLTARAHFESTLTDAQGDSARVLLDIGALTLIDCAGMFVLFTAAERSRREHGVLILLNPRGQVRRMVDRVGAPTGVAVLECEDLPVHWSQVAA